MANENMTSSIYEHFNSMLQSGQIWAQGFAEISKTFAYMAQAHLEANLAVMKALTNAKSTQEMLNIQTDYVKKTVDSTISDSKKLADSTDKLAHENIAAMKADGAAANVKNKHA